MVTVPDMRWRVGVLRLDSENIDWTASGAQPSWLAAGRCAHAALGELVAREGQRQEYWVDIGRVLVIVWPGIDESGNLEIPAHEELLPCGYDLPRCWRVPGVAPLDQ